jgi:DNA-binding Lrp family transcriptional regulator
MQAFILIHTELGRAEQVAGEVRGLRKVLNSEAVTGPYDVIARVEVDALDHVYDELIPAIRDIPGVMRSVACPSVGHRYVAETIAA